MSPGSPVFLTKVRASIGLKNKLRVGTFGKQDWVNTDLQIEGLTLIQNIRENRLRHARGPVQNTESVT